jgi:hypothetical protein
LFFGSEAFTEADAGMYILDRGATAPRRLLTRPVGRIRVGEATIVAAVESVHRGSHEIVAVSASSLRTRWSARNHAFTVDTDGGDVASLEPSAGGRRVVLRDERSGDVRWMSVPLDQEPVDLFFGGDVVCAHMGEVIAILDRRDGSMLDRLDGQGRAFSWGGGFVRGRLSIGLAREVVCYVSASRSGDIGGRS